MQIGNRAYHKYFWNSLPNQAETSRESQREYGMFCYPVLIFKAVLRIFFEGGLTKKKIGGGFTKKNLKNAYKICLCPFLLRFCDSGKHFGGGGRGSNPLWIRHY
jgi:hypothetical protein